MAPVVKSVDPQALGADDGRSQWAFAPQSAIRMTHRDLPEARPANDLEQ